MAAAIQWLDPSQTAGGKYPFMFTQSQAILARSWVPLQDGPGVKFTYSAAIACPVNLMALMSAENDTVKHTDGVYHFKQSNPIPSYLMALAVGDIAFKSLGKLWNLCRTIIAAIGCLGICKYGNYDTIR